MLLEERVYVHAHVCEYVCEYVCVCMCLCTSWGSQALPLLSPIGIKGGIMAGRGPPSGLGVLTMV